MNFAVSNIAWPASQRLASYEVLEKHSIQGLEIAPGLFFEGAEDVFRPEASLLRARLAETDARGLRLVSMQSLLFGVAGAALFEDTGALARLEEGIVRAIELAERLDIPNLVFGSPKQRVVPLGMDLHEAQKRAGEIFVRLGDRAVAAGTVIAMEANPKEYGTNFLNRSEDVLDFVTVLDHPGVRMVLDIGATRINGGIDRIPQLIAKTTPVLSHVHISEPFLAPAPSDASLTAEILSALTAVDYARFVSIEMKATKKTPVDSMTGALERLLEAAQIARAG